MQKISLLPVLRFIILYWDAEHFLAASAEILNLILGCRTFPFCQCTLSESYVRTQNISCQCRDSEIYVGMQNISLLPVCNGWGYISNIRGNSGKEIIPKMPIRQQSLEHNTFCNKHVSSSELPNPIRIIFIKMMRIMCEAQTRISSNTHTHIYSIDSFT